MPPPNIKDSPKKEQASGHFVAMLQAKTSGTTLADLDIKLAELVRDVRETTKPGKITLTIKVVPNAKKGVTIEDDLTVKPPKADTGKSFFYATENGTLVKNDPEQREMEFQTVPDDRAPAPKVVNN